MATRLKNLRIKKVDFVDEGANPDAHIMLYKNRDAAEEPVENGEEGNVNILKRVVSSIAKTFGVKENQLGVVIEGVQKGDSESFDERYVEVKNRKIADEIWDVCFALQSSLYSILNDDDLDGTQTSTAMTESLDEFYEVVKDAITQWSNGKANNIVRKNDEVTEAELENMKSVQKRLEESIEKSVVIKEEKNIEKSKGDEEMALVNIDKSKLTSAERAFLEDIEKRCSTNQAAGQENTDSGAGEESGETVAKSTSEAPESNPAPAEPPKPEPEPSDVEDIYKGLHPLVKEEIQSLRKFRKAAEDRELNEIAKRYTIIGKKAEELVPMFKSLKAAGGTAFDDMIAVLDQAVETAENSGAFSEIGKSGHGETTDGEAWAEADAKAVELMKSKPSLTKNQALDEVLMADPELAKKCEEEG